MSERGYAPVKVIVRWRPLALCGLVLLGLLLRLYGLNWDQGNSFHPDERQIMFHVTALSWPKSLSQFLDPVNSPLNPHFFAYGSFPLYLLAILGNVLTHFWPALGSFTNLTLVGRVLSALFDSGTILLTGLLGLRLAEDTMPGRPHAWNLALLAATLVAFTPLQLQLSHFYAVDTMLLFFTVLTVLGCVALVDTDKPLRWSLLIGLAYGLAVGTKFSAAPLGMPLLVAVFLRWYRRDFASALLSFVLALFTTVVVFLIVEPYALLDTKNVVEQIAEQGSLARGVLDLPYVRQFAGTIPYVYEAQNMVVWGLGLLLGISVLVGLAWFLWRTWRRTAGLWMVLLAWVLIYGAIIGSFYVKFMRYTLPIYPFLVLMAAALLLAVARYDWRNMRLSGMGEGLFRVIVAGLRYGAIVLVLAGTIFQGLALLNVYSEPNTRVLASRWMYAHIPAGSTLTYEQWDDPLPVAVGSHDPSLYNQLTYTSPSGQPTTGLDLYGDDTTEKAQLLAHLLPSVNVLTMATDRLDKSIPRLPMRYPLTIHYYQLLFSGQLGFHLAAQFENRPHLLGITLDDSNADESYSVFDHPHVRIFVRDTPYPYTEAQLFQKLLDGVQLPPAAAHLSGAQRSLMLSPQQIADDQQSPPFGVQFPADSLTNAMPVLFWWLALFLLALCAYPLLFLPFRALSDRGYIFGKVMSVLFLSYLAWLPATLHLLPFSHTSLLLAFFVLALVGAGAFFVQRHMLLAFARQHWRILFWEEVLFSGAYLLFVGIRALNPDLWHIYLGGEKPMELAFLHAVLRSPYMPPLDPWFAGGYINYYYYGYVLFGSLIKLTAIVPTTAFNLAIPTLFAMTLSGVVVIVYSFTRRVSFALLGGYFAVLIGNFNGLSQLKGQVLAMLAHLPVPMYDYWQSSRVIPFTINEFPFWSFLFADLHPHVIDMPITVCMLGIIATLLLSASPKQRKFPAWRLEQGLLLLLAAFIFGTIACINPWDMPLYAILLAVVLLLQRFSLRTERETRLELVLALLYRVVMVTVIYGLGYLCYLPFYANYQQLYVNGLAQVKLGTTLSDFLTIFGLWIFLATSFFAAEAYRRWHVWNRQRRMTIAVARYYHRRRGGSASAFSTSSFAFVAGALFLLFPTLGVKWLLAALLVLGIFLWGWSLLTRGASLSSATSYTYLLLVVGVGICLGMELVYVRDFLDGGDYARMNTVFKFSIQAWFCFAIGGALVAHRLWDIMGNVVRRAWSVILVVLVLGCSVFLIEGTGARIHDHQWWLEAQPVANVATAKYIPSLDGAAFMRAWYPEDAQAIAWLNAYVAGSPVILEAAAPVSFQWYNRVSVFTGLPDVLGWPDHVGEQRYDYQAANRLADIGFIYTTLDTAQALELLLHYHVRYVYVGPLEHQLYAQQSSAGLEKFAHMNDTLHAVYNANDVVIYELVYPKGVEG